MKRATVGSNTPVLRKGKLFYTVGKSMTVPNLYQYTNDISDTLGGFMRTVYKLLKIRATTSYVILKTGVSRLKVHRAINQLIQRNLITRIDRGVYDVSLFTVGHPDVSLGNVAPVCSDTKKNEPEKVRLRMHNLQIGIKISSANLGTMKHIIFSDRSKYNVRGCATGKYFDFAGVTGLLCSDALYVYFPDSWELFARDVRDLTFSLYDELKSLFFRWEQHFSFVFFKDGRVNFDIRRVHIAIENHPLAHIMNKAGFNLNLFDSADGKQRLLTDMSKGFPEIEAVHRDHAFEDADNYMWLNRAARDGTLEKMVSLSNFAYEDAHSALKLSGDSKIDISDLQGEIKDIKIVFKDLVGLTESLALGIKANTSHISVLLDLVIPQANKMDGSSKSVIHKGVPDYVG